MRIFIVIEMKLTLQRILKMKGGMAVFEAGLCGDELFRDERKREEDNEEVHCSDGAGHRLLWFGCRCSAV